MFKQPMDLIQEVDWEGLPRKRTKRVSSYLTNDRLNDLVNTNVKLALSAPRDIVTAPHSIVTATPRDIVKGSFIIPLLKRITQLPFTIPSLIGFLHLLLNFFVIAVLISSICYLLYYARIDILYKIASKREETRVSIQEAERLYILNKCDPTTRVPGMEFQCGQWECLIRNGFSGIKYMRIVAEMFADVLDGFVAKFSYKSLGTILVLFVACLIFRR